MPRYNLEVTDQKILLVLEQPHTTEETASVMGICKRTAGLHIQQLIRAGKVQETLSTDMRRPKYIAIIKPEVAEA